VTSGISIVVATYGDRSIWDPLAERAVRSAVKEVPGAFVHRIHGETLHGARNAGLECTKTEHIIFLDADDELEPGYVETLLRGTADVRAPAVRYVHGVRPGEPKMPKVSGHTHDCVAECLAFGNYIIIGAMVRTELLRRVGGWHDHAWSEDFCTWVRCWKAAATFESLPQAVYRAHVRANSRNRAPDRAAKLDAHREIACENGLPVPA